MVRAREGGLIKTKIRAWKLTGFFSINMMQAFLHTVFAVMLEEEQLLGVCLCLWGAGDKKAWGWSLPPIATGMWAGPRWQQGSSWGLPPRGTKCLGLACLKCACGHLSSASDNRPWTHTHFSFMHNAASYLGLFSLSITSVVWGHTVKTIEKAF